MMTSKRHTAALRHRASEKDSETRLIDPRMLELLVCPRSRQPLHFDASRQELVCDHSGLAYPVRDGVPILLISEARHLDD